MQSIHSFNYRTFPVSISTPNRIQCLAPTSTETLWLFNLCIHAEFLYSIFIFECFYLHLAVLYKVMHNMDNQSLIDKHGHDGTRKPDWRLLHYFSFRADKSDKQIQINAGQQQKLQEKELKMTLPTWIDSEYSLDIFHLLAGERLDFSSYRIHDHNSCCRWR